MVLEKVRESRALVHFVRERLPHYGPLVSGDLRRFREEIVRATVGACIAMFAGLVFACFLSVAAIVSAWNGPHRIAAAWLICGAWGLLALVGLAIARKAVASASALHVVGTALARDYALRRSPSSDSGARTAAPLQTQAPLLFRWFRCELLRPELLRAGNAAT